MTDKLCLHLFGVPQFIYEDEPVTGLAAKKTRALLIYLAVTGRPHSRDALANLLWADKPKTARQNLKKAISTLRKNPYIPLIEQSDRLLRIDLQQVWIDVTLFEAVANDAPNQTIDQLQQAIALYIDDFLAGFNLSISLEFEAWALGVQNQLKADSLNVLQELAHKQDRKGDLAGAVEALQKYLRIEPWHEQIHRHVMRLLTRMGNRGAALLQYEHCCDALRIELDVEPDPQTVALMEKIRRNEIEDRPLQPESTTPIRQDEQARSAFRSSNLPAGCGTLIGREQELEEINRLLSENEARLITILGIGGIGKTQLAVTAAQAQFGRFADGVLWVPLAALSQADDISFAIGDVLQYQFQGKQTPEEQIIALLRDRQMLLVLDNFEHLLDGALFIANILTRAPQVSILTTSRERLKLLQETVLQLDGLTYPQAQYETKNDYPALQLFMTQMHRVRPDLGADDADVQAIVEICQLVQGTPLGILLAASWGSLLNPAEILAEVRRGLDILETDLRDVPQRQRSIRIVFEQTWARLSKDERNVLMRLSIFRGGFTQKAAEVIAGATLPLLLGLYDKALIGRAPNGRFDLHELLRQFAEERLTKDDLANESRDAHSEYYLNLLINYEAKLKGYMQLPTLSKFKSEQENIRQAWDWAVAQVQFEQLFHATEGLCIAYHLADDPTFGERACRKAIEALSSIPMPSSATSTTKIQHARAKLLIWHAKFSRELGGASLARQLLEESLVILAELEAASLDVRAEKGATLSSLGDLTWYTDVRSARKILSKSLELCRAAGDQWQEAYVLREFARSLWATGELETGKLYIDQSLRLRRAMQNRAGIAQSLAVASWIAMEQGELDEAMRYAKERLAISQQIGGVGTISEATFNLGAVHFDRGEFPKARSRFIEAQGLAKEAGKRHHENSCTIGLSKAEVHMGDYSQAVSDAQTVLRVAGEINLRSHRGAALINSGRAHLANGNYDSALTHASESLAIIDESQQLLKRSWVLDLLGFAELGRENHEAARNHLTQLLEEFSNHYALVRALPLATLLLLDDGQVGYAIQLYSIANRYPFIAHSRWYADVVGKHIDAAVSPSSGNQTNLIEFDNGQELHKLVPWIFDALSLRRTHRSASVE